MRIHRISYQSLDGVFWCSSTVVVLVVVVVVVVAAAAAAAASVGCGLQWLPRPHSLRWRPHVYEL